MSNITAIGRIRVDLGFTEADAALEVKTTFGEGGNPEATINEEYLGFVNTPVTKDGYTRVLVKRAFGAALDYIKSIGGAESIELLDVEWEGQKMFQVGVIPAYTADGIDHPEQIEYLGFIAGAPMYVEPTIEEEI